MPPVGFSLLLITDGTGDLAALRAVLAAVPASQVAVQLRNRSASGRTLLELAASLRQLTQHHGAALLVNDRVDIALAVAADGVHLPGGGLPVAAVRRLLGPTRLISAATHSLADVRTRAAEGVDCVTFGPIWPTPSKPDDPQVPAAARVSPVGPTALATVVAQSPVVLFALGGIDTPTRAATCTATGARLATLHGILTAQNPVATALAMLAATVPPL